MTGLLTVPPEAPIIMSLMRRACLALGDSVNPASLSTGPSARGQGPRRRDAAQVPNRTLLRRYLGYGLQVLRNKCRLSRMNRSDSTSRKVCSHSIIITGWSWVSSWIYYCELVDPACDRWRHSKLKRLVSPSSAPALCEGGIRAPDALSVECIVKKSPDTPCMQIEFDSVQLLKMARFPYRFPFLLIIVQC